MTDIADQDQSVCRPIAEYAALYIPQIEAACKRGETEFTCICFHAHREVLRLFGEHFPGRSITYNAAHRKPSSPLRQAPAH